MAAGCDQSRGELKMEEKMLKLNDTVMYGTTGVCTVENIEKKNYRKGYKNLLWVASEGADIIHCFFAG